MKTKIRTKEKKERKKINETRKENVRFSENTANFFSGFVTVFEVDTRIFAFYNGKVQMPY